MRKVKASVKVVKPAIFVRLVRYNQQDVRQAHTAHLSQLSAPLAQREATVLLVYHLQPNVIKELIVAQVYHRVQFVQLVFTVRSVQLVKLSAIQGIIAELGKQNVKFVLEDSTVHLNQNHPSSVELDSTQQVALRSARHVRQVSIATNCHLYLNSAQVEQPVRLALENVME